MAIDPSKLTTNTPRFSVNDALTYLQLGDPKAYLIESTSRIVRECPPCLPWASPFRNEVFRGFFIGPTSIALFFWILYNRHPDLAIEGKATDEWCRAYLALGQDKVAPGLEATCGMTNEYLASNVLKACLDQSEQHAEKVLSALRNIDTDPTYCEWLKGRAGALYILRVMKQGVPHLAKDIELVIKELIEAILAQQPWKWNDRQYLGTVHGEIGILTQIILSDSSYATQLEDKLLSLLNLQGENSNWPVVEGKDIGLVQFCHGAPGFILSLLSLKPFFPSLHSQIDKAVEIGRKLIWKRGLLTKEPNICHGISGNSLALDTRQREQFLCLATPQRIEAGVANGVFERDEDPFGLLWGESGRAWVWLEVWDGSEGKCVLYSDV